ncbi:MAG: hypothetical protein AAFQ98_07995, partial [Bacteroidota bacterium]
GYVFYSGFYNPETELWCPANIDWPRDMENAFPSLVNVNSWYQQFTSISLENPSYYDGYTEVIDILANQRRVDTDGSENFAKGYSYNF